MASNAAALAAVLLVALAAASPIEVPLIPGGKPVAFPFKRLANMKSKSETGVFATERDFNRHCFGFIYAAVNDPAAVTEDSVSQAVKSACTASDEALCNNWASDLWQVVSRKVQREHMDNADGAGLTPVSKSYTAWCHEVFQAQGGQPDSLPPPAGVSVVEPEAVHTAEPRVAFKAAGHHGLRKVSSAMHKKQGEGDTWNDMEARKLAHKENRPAKKHSHKEPSPIQFVRSKEPAPLTFRRALDPAPVHAVKSLATSNVEHAKDLMNDVEGLSIANEVSNNNAKVEELDDASSALAAALGAAREARGK